MHLCHLLEKVWQQHYTLKATDVPPIAVELARETVHRDFKIIWFWAGGT